MVVLGVTALAQTNFTPIYLPGSWPVATWWTNVPYPTRIEASNAWYAVNENFLRASNAVRALSQTFTNVSTNLFPATNTPAAGNTIRWNGTNWYWAP
jgi:hypothetical protein